MNPYDVLDIPETATDAEIKAAYKAKAQKAHPDRKGGSVAVFKLINEAYRELRDREDPVDVKLRQLFEIIIDNEKFQGDIVAEAKRITTQTLEMAERNHKETKRKLSRYEAMSDRVTSPHYEQVIEGKIDQMVGTGRLQESEIVVLKELLERLAPLKDVSPEPSWMPAGGFGGV